MTGMALPKNMSARVAVVVVALSLAWFGQHAAAQSCKDLPPGPAKKQCRMQNHPEVFNKKKQRCLDLAVQRGADEDRPVKRDFMQSCMHGKVGG